MAILFVNRFRKKAMHSCNCVCLLNETLLTFYIHWTSKRTRFEIEYTTESFCPDNGVPKIEKKKKELRILAFCSGFRSTYVKMNAYVVKYLPYLALYWFSSALQSSAVAMSNVQQKSTFELKSQRTCEFRCSFGQTSILHYHCPVCRSYAARQVRYWYIILSLWPPDPGWVIM